MKSAFHHKINLSFLQYTYRSKFPASRIRIIPVKLFMIYMPLKVSITYMSVKIILKKDEFIRYREW